MTPEGIETSGFSADVITPLRRLARRLKWHLVVAGLAQSAALLLILAVLQLLLDMILVLGIGPRIALFGILAAVAGYQSWLRVIRPALARVSVEDLAAVLERARPALADRLISAVALARAPRRPERNSPAMVAALVRDARRSFSSVHPQEILNRTRHRRFAGLGLAVVLAAAGAYLLAPDIVATYIARDLLLQDAAWPSRTRIIVEGVSPNKILWPLGDDLTLVATAEGDVPRMLRAQIRLPGGQSATRDLSRRGENQFVLDYGPLASSMKLRFLIERFGVDEPTGWYDVEAVERPAVREATLAVTPPPYTGLPPIAWPAGQTSAEVLRGSSVAISATLNKEVATAVLRYGGQRVADAVHEPDQRIRAEFTPAAGGTYYFDLTDTGGLADLHPVTYAIRVVSDSPPKVRLNLPGAGEMVVPGAVLDLEVDCEDNLGLRIVELLYRVTQEGPAAATQPEPAGERLPGFEAKLPRFQVRHAWPLSSLSMKPGDQVTLLVRAADYQPAMDAQGKGPAPGVGESPGFTLKVVTAEELLAELGRRENEWRREFEQIIKSQEQIKKRVADLHDRAGAKGFSNEAATAYGAEETAQRGQIGRLKTVRRQFEQVLAELKVNQLVNTAVRRRLDGGVIQPLGRLIGTDCVAAADLMATLRRDYSVPRADHVEEAQARLVQDMNAVLANMLKWEGYNEAVGLLRDVIRLQGDVNRQTQKRLEEQAENLFGPGATSKPEDE